MLQNNLMAERFLNEARSLVGTFPWAHEAILVLGSVSKGFADVHSDVEILFLVDHIPEEKDRIAWIEQIDGEQVSHYGAPLFDGSVWSIFKRGNQWFEVGMQRADTAAALLSEVADGRHCDHDHLLLASAYSSAIWMKTSDRFDGIRVDLEVYPENLKERVIMETLKTWGIKLAWEVRRALAKRHDRLPLMQRLILDCQRVMRIVQALNGMWETDYKWFHHHAVQLAIKPVDLAKRLDRALTLDDPVEALRCMEEVIIETIGILPEEIRKTPEAEAVLQIMG